MHAIGARIHQNRYEVLHAFPRSGQGEAYRVHDHHEDQQAVLKLLDVSQLSGNWQWDEARILRRLAGDFILPVLNADLTAGVPFIVTEFAVNGSLDAATPATGMPPPVAVRYVREACRGVTRTLDRGLLHRDIKPDNIFIDHRQRARLGDFGLAYKKSPNGVPAAGTLSTMAPEVVAGGQCTVASEVYSLGASLYYALAGKFPHDPRRYVDARNRLDVGQLSTAVVTTEPPGIRDVAPHVSVGLGQVVEKALGRNPDDRYASPQDLDEALGGLREDRRLWCRTDEHPNHEACWRGQRPGQVDAVVCAVPAVTSGVKPKWEIDARKSASGNRITEACKGPATARQLPARIRSAIRAAT